jgi:hypothetical protein
MMILGCDYHPGFQQIACVDTETGELQERRLQDREEAERFYRDLAVQGMKVRVGMEASGHARWFERLLGELQFELWIGDAAEIRTKRVRKQKTDRQDAQLIFLEFVLRVCELIIGRRAICCRLASETPGFFRARAASASSRVQTNALNEVDCNSGDKLGSSSLPLIGDTCS